MANRPLPQTTTDYEGAAGGNVVPPLYCHGVPKLPGKGANMPPNEPDRYGGKGFAERVARASNLDAD